MAIANPPRQAAAFFLLSAVAAAVQAQAVLAPITVTSPPSPPTADVTGFGDVPLKDVPVSATVIGRKQIEASGARRLADLTSFDPSVADAYNAPGYWDFLSIRGFTLDNRFNYRREGLPINAETTIPLDNKERVEILKGTSGIQAGTSAPGGLVNYVVKRPSAAPLREVRLEATARSSLLGALDLGGRFGRDDAFGYRINVAQERLRPLVHSLDGERSLVAAAADWRLGRDSLLEGEFEWSRKRQPSQAGFSLLGPALPAVPDPRINLNNQAWVPLSGFEGLTGTLRYSQPLSRDWRWVAQLGSQRLRSDDFTAFPFGCGAEGNFDRFCSDGTFDLYDFRSENERRRQDAASLALKGRVAAGGIAHDLSFGLLASRVRIRTQPQAFNFAGVGDITGLTAVPPEPTLASPGTSRNERSTELSAQDAIRWNDRLTTWLGVRHTKLARDTVATDGSSATSYSQGLTTPWAAVSYRLTPAVTAYASWGEGVESQVVPNNAAVFANAGAALPALKSRQKEIGAKGASGAWGWQVAAFDIRRPMTNLDFCNLTFSFCTGRFDGEAAHRGLEAAVQWTDGPWRVSASAMRLRARREGSVENPAANGLRPINVPEAVVRAQAAFRVPDMPGLELSAGLSHEGRRAVLADNSLFLPAWTRADAALRYETRSGNVATAWTFGVDNVTNRRYWKESPFQFGHVYLYPGAPRTWRLGFTASL